MSARILYTGLAAAANDADPGDTILIHAGNYSGGLFISNLQGTPGAWITIRNAPGETVVFEGGSNAIQFTDPAWLHMRGLIFQHQTGNGLNTDDGGTYATPAHDVVFESVPSATFLPEATTTCSSYRASTIFKLLALSKTARPAAAALTW